MRVGYRLVGDGERIGSMKECGIWKLITLFCVPPNIFICDRKRAVSEV